MLNKNKYRYFPFLLAFLSIVLISAHANSQNRDSLQGELKKPHNNIEQFKIWALIEPTYLFSGQLDSALFYTSQMFQLANKLNNDSLRVIAYSYTGGYYDNIGDYKQALINEFAGDSICEKDNFLRGYCLDAKEMGIVYKDMKDFPEALKYLKIAEAELPEITKTDYQKLKTNSAFITFGSLPNRVYSHLSETWLGLGNTDSALHYIDLANENTVVNKDPYGFARVQYIYALVHAYRHEDDDAEKKYYSCIYFCQQARLTMPLVDACADFSSFLLKNCFEKRAKYFALEGLKAAQQCKNKKGIIKAATVLTSIYKTSNTDSAFYYANIKDSCSDYVFNAERMNTLQAMTYSQLSKEKKYDKAKSDQNLQRLNNLWFLGIAIGVICFLILILILSQSIIVNTRMVRFFGIIGLLVTFQFINLLISAKFTNSINGSPIVTLMVMICIAACLTPLHNRLESWTLNRLVEKNKNIRLKTAKKILKEFEELENTEEKKR